MSVEIIGYSFDADHHCLDCTPNEWKVKDENNEKVYDSEGNLVHAILSTDDIGSSTTCGNCFLSIWSVAGYVEINTDEDDGIIYPEEECDPERNAYKLCEKLAQCMIDNNCNLEVARTIVKTNIMLFETWIYSFYYEFLAYKKAIEDQSRWEKTH